VAVHSALPLPAIVVNTSSKLGLSRSGPSRLTIVDAAESIACIKLADGGQSCSFTSPHSLIRPLIRTHHPHSDMPCNLFKRKQQNTAASSPSPAIPNPAPVAGSSRSSASQPRLPPSPPKQSKPIPIPQKRRENNNSGGLYEDPYDPRVGIPEYQAPSTMNKGKRRK
jgi:hypothetical protein